MDKDAAIKATRNGAIAAFISAALTFVLVLIAVGSNADTGYLSLLNDPSVFLDVALILACGYGMLRRSRAAAVTIFIYFIISKFYLALETGRMPGLGISLVFLYFYGRAIQGAITYHKILKAENQNYKAAPKWMYYAGIPLGLLVIAFTVFGLMTMTDMLPSTKVLTGAEISSKNVSLLIENGVISDGEKIEYFYSEGFTSILEGGSVLTERRVIAYVREEGNILVYDLPIQEITSVKLIEQGNYLNDSIYEVSPDNKDAWIRLILSVEDRGDIKFVEALRNKINDSKSHTTGRYDHSPSKQMATDIFKENNEAIVLVRTYNENGDMIGFGSGFNVSDKGVIVTNLHVVLSGGHYLEIKFPKHGTYEDVYIAGFTDVSTDLAVLRIDGKDLPTVNINPTAPVNVGDSIYTISNPEGLVNSFSEGIVSAERGAGKNTFYQITAPISEGSSGGAVFNDLGEVIGVATLVMKEGQNLNFAVPIEQFEHIEVFEEYFSLKDLMDYLNTREE